MAANPTQCLETIGLGGDGDEVDAILEVERHFGVALDYADAPRWLTAGDVFASLLTALPPDKRDGEDLWATFTAIMCSETGADASRVGPDTLLLGLPLSVVISRWLVECSEAPATVDDRYGSTTACQLFADQENYPVEMFDASRARNRAIGAKLPVGPTQ